MKNISDALQYVNFQELFDELTIDATVVFVKDDLNDIEKSRERNAFITASATGLYETAFDEINDFNIGRTYFFGDRIQMKFTNTAARGSDSGMTVELSSYNGKAKDIYVLLENISLKK